MSQPNDLTEIERLKSDFETKILFLDQSFNLPQN